MKHFSIILTTCLLFCDQAICAPSSKPNIVIILDDDFGETKNLAAAMPEKVVEMKNLLEKLITAGRSTPGHLQKNDAAVVRYPKQNAAPAKPKKLNFLPIAIAKSQMIAKRHRLMRDSPSPPC